MSEENKVPRLVGKEVTLEAPYDLATYDPETVQKFMDEVNGVVVDGVLLEGHYTPSGGIEVEATFLPTKAGLKALERLRDALTGQQRHVFEDITGAEEGRQ
jgi:hypothetical protein